jgi:hypothetical protein
MAQTLKQMIGGLVSGRRPVGNDERQREAEMKCWRGSQRQGRGEELWRERKEIGGGRRENNVDGFGIERADTVPQLEKE